MQYCMFLIILGFPNRGNSFWPAPYRVDLNDRKTFVISAGEDNNEDDEENENEMIRPADLAGIVDLSKYNERYKPLHSYVEHYNRRAAETAKQYSSLILNPDMKIDEVNLSEEERPFIAGFKSELDEYKFDRAVKSGNGKSKYANEVIEKSFKNSDSENRRTRDRLKRQEEEEDLDLNEHSDGDLVEPMSPSNHSLEVDEAKEGEHETSTTETVDSVSSTTERVKEENLESVSSTTERVQGENLESVSATTERVKEENLGSVSSTTERVEEYEDQKTSILENLVTPDSDKNSAGTEINEKPTNIFRDFGSTQPSEFDETKEEAYDYESLRAEYEQQLIDAKNSNMTFNYTDKEEPEETPNDALKKIVEFDKPKNCTQEELTKFGAKAFACLAFDYHNAKNRTEIRKIFARTWRVVKIWICIYVCIAVPAWCQKGWCCCCCRCSICFPHKRIYIAKKYYAHNEPGVLVDQPSKKGGKSETIHYKPTLFEIDAYEEFGSAIRNL